jgi:thiamine-phosphate pyrophosphorylase
VHSKKKCNIDFKLYLITDRKIITHYPSLITAVQEALKGGVSGIQLREKDLETRELLKLAYKMRAITGTYRARLFINDRIDIALAVKADGVHLTQNSIPVNAVKRVVKNRLLIGVSTHSLKEARNAERGGADFITYGPVYRTPSKLKYGKPLGTNSLKNVCKKTNLPVFAIGGVKTGKIKEIGKTGAHGVAMISEILKAYDIAKKTATLLEEVRKSISKGICH